ncbi:tetratricopeptide repeat protein [Neobacillus sp. MM2021_6]|uniref:tetratricopeptide repeat protein n=1 Tax=Bacillaceae TaxID=186817 RepID=UPI00140A5D43|nr:MULTISPECIES: tetratricopeptide repeat protein [Bacillaceae]MBO0959030.1 tetratricopeptide repeat protein [Neobacillus sp. MM2021_6]NHC17760.1 tetratricopeptide repeat protein [Bacillus sp. MM2020_4]
MVKDLMARMQKGKLLSFVPTGEYYFTKGLKAYHRRDFIKAKKYLGRAIQLEPGEPMITCQLAIVSTELGEFENSNRLLHLVIEELDPEMAECHYFLANNYAHMGFFKDAYHHSKLYLQLDPDGDFSEDTEDLLDLLTLESDDFEDELYQEDDLIIKQEQARELLESGYFPKAIELLKEVVKEYPEYWSAYNNLALAYFYLGKVERAESILEDVLERNPGNLHALCNRLVFAHYQGQSESAAELLEPLKKIQPLLSEYQFKLGATFALVGEYELAYIWLKKLYRHGFNGDGPFYYWLSYAAYFTGYENFAKSIWKKVLEITPDKEGLEPWNDKNPRANGFEDYKGSIFQKLESDYVEERLFALFLTTVSSKKEEIITSKRLFQNQKFTSLEKEYISLIRSGKPSMIADAQEIAEIFYENYHPIGAIESGLYLMWFSVFVEISKADIHLKNKRAWAAAVEYLWHKLRSEKVSQLEVAGRYGLSPATIGKYVKLVNNYLN